MRQATPLQALLDALGWSRAHAAARLGASGSTVRYWAEGTNTRGNPAEAPAWATDYLARVLAAVDSVPRPHTIEQPIGASSTKNGSRA